MTETETERFQARIDEIRWRRLVALNEQSRRDLEKQRILVLNASLLLADYVRMTRDYMVPEVWGRVLPLENRYARAATQQAARGEAVCCVVV